MINPLYYLFALLILMLYPTGSEPLFVLRPEQAARTILGVTVPTIPLMVATLTIAYALTAALLFRIASRASPLIAPVRLLSTSRALRLIALILFAVEVYLLHWHFDVVERWGIADIPLLPSLAGFLPLFALSTIHALFAVAQAVRIGRAARYRDALIFHFRCFAAFGLFPLVVIILLNDLLMRSSSLQRFFHVHPFAGWLAGIVFIIAFLALIPPILRFVLGVRPLPAGPLRERLTALCAGVGLSHGGFYVWNTRGARIGNAFITGVAGRLRYIFFTDYLLNRLPPEEVEAVAGHEIAHATRRHTLLYLVLAIAYMTMLTFIHDEWLAKTRDPLFLTIVTFGLAVAFWILFFGYASRRFEMEADLMGARIAGDAAVFLRALRNVSLINGLPMEIRSLQHFSIARRTGLLHAAQEDPAVADRILRSAARLKKAFVLFFAVAVALEAWSIGRQWDEAATRERQYDDWMAAEEGIRAYDRGEMERAEEMLQGAAQKTALDDRGYIALARMRIDAGRRSPEEAPSERDALLGEAAEYYRRAIAAGITDPRLRLEAETFLNQEENE